VEAKLPLTDHGKLEKRADGHFSVYGQCIATLGDISDENYVASMKARNDTDAAIVMCFHDIDNYIAAVYSAKDRSIYLIERTNRTAAPNLDVHPSRPAAAQYIFQPKCATTWERCQSPMARSYVAPIVGVQEGAARVEPMHTDDHVMQNFSGFEVRASRVLSEHELLRKRLYDAQGAYRGDLTGLYIPADQYGAFAIGSGWDDFGKHKHILLWAYRPERFPFSGDWVLVLAVEKQ
jgi:hypothetical protein